MQEKPPKSAEGEKGILGMVLPVGTKVRTIGGTIGHPEGVSGTLENSYDGSGWAFVKFDDDDEPGSCDPTRITIE
jgi:hypothetical protein